MFFYYYFWVLKKNMAFISCPVLFRNACRKIISKNNDQVQSSFNMFSHRTWIFFANHMEVLGGFCLFLKVANGLKQSFTAPRSSCCRSIHVGMVRFRRHFKKQLLWHLNAIQIVTLTLSWRCWREDALEKSLCNNHKTCSPKHNNHRSSSSVMFRKSNFIEPFYSFFPPSGKKIKSQNYPNSHKVPSLLPGSMVTWKWFSALIWAGFCQSCAGDPTSESSDALYLSILVKPVRFGPPLKLKCFKESISFSLKWAQKNNWNILYKGLSGSWQSQHT